MPLRSARFAGDPTLEAVLNHSTKLQKGSTGTAVVKVQQALLDLGFQMPRFGADGSYGDETVAAVKSFQSSKGLRPIDGIIGADTMRALDAAFPAALGGGPANVLPPGIHWGVDTAAPANAAVLHDGVPITLFDLINLRLGMPEFWGRYLFGSAGLGVTALNKTEAQFIFDSSNGACRILLIDNIAASRFNQGFEIGKQDAQVALGRCAALSVPKGVMVYADIEPQFQCSSGWIRGWWEVMLAAGRGRGGLYCDPTQIPFNRPHRAALKATLDILSAALNPDQPFFPPDPPFAARLIWTQRPIRFFKKPVDPSNFKPDAYTPTEPTYQLGMTAIWQYAGNCPVVPGSHQVIDMNLANELGLASMWKGK